MPVGRGRHPVRTRTLKGWFARADSYDTSPSPGGHRAPFPGIYAPTAAPADRAPRLLVGLSILVVLAVIAGGAYVVLRGGRQYPSAWDPRVGPIATWVAEERDLAFDHPVDVQFLTDDEYREASTGGEDVADPTQDAALDDALAQLRALGLIAGEVDLGEATDTLSDSGTLAYYDAATEKVYVRGQELTPALRVTLAHELTHVLQDQRFDLERLGDLDEGESSTLRALAEGDAGRIEDIYAAEELTAEERTAYEADAASSGTEATEKLEADVPPILTALFAAPYVFGPSLVANLDRSGGSKAIDEALQDPPGEDVLFNPLLDGTDAAGAETLTVEAPKGSEVIDDGEFGPTAWYLLLASRLEPSTALRATDGLAGDGYTVFRTDDRVCVQARADGDAESDVTDLNDALTAWVAQSPPDTASVEVVDGVVRFESCDPGADAKAVGSVSVELLQLPVLRTQLYGEVIAAEGTDAMARCVAQAVIDRFAFSQIVAGVLTGPEGQQALGEIGISCR